MVIHQNWSSKIHSPQKKALRPPKTKRSCFHDDLPPLFVNFWNWKASESMTKWNHSFWRNRQQIRVFLSLRKKRPKKTPLIPPRSPWLALVTRRIFWVPQTRRTHLSERSGSYPKLVGCGNYHRLDVIVCENSSQKKNHPSWSIMSCVENSKLWSIWGGFPKVVAGKLSDLQIKFWKHPKW